MDKNHRRIMNVSSTWHIAEVNVAKIRAPYTDPIMADFVNALERINGLAEKAPGFVWRLKTIDSAPGDEQDLFGQNVIVNMSVWESLDQLLLFTYSGPHVEIYRRRTDWMDQITDTTMALWWVQPGTQPTLEDAFDRLERVRKHGSTPQAFTIKQRFPMPVAKNILA